MSKQQHVVLRSFAATWAIYVSFTNNRELLNLLGDKVKKKNVYVFA